MAALKHSRKALCERGARVKRSIGLRTPIHQVSKLKSHGKNFKKNNKKREAVEKKTKNKTTRIKKRNKAHTKQSKRIR